MYVFRNIHVYYVTTIKVKEDMNIKENKAYTWKSLRNEIEVETDVNISLKIFYKVIYNSYFSSNMVLVLFVISFLYSISFHKIWTWSHNITQCACPSV